MPAPAASQTLSQAQAHTFQATTPCRRPKHLLPPQQRVSSTACTVEKEKLFAVSGRCMLGDRMLADIYHAIALLQGAGPVVRWVPEVQALQQVQGSHF